MLIGASGAADAAVILDTIDTKFETYAGWELTSNVGGVSNFAVAFSSPRAAEITNIVAYLSINAGRANDTIGIMGDSGGLPDGTFLYSEPAPLFWETISPVTLSGLDWAISKKTTYWLVVEADPSGVDTWWQWGNETTGGVGYFSTDDQSWFIEGPGLGVPLPEAEISASFTRRSIAAPEPSTWAMMLLGFAGLGYAGYRRARADRSTLAA